MRKLFVLFVLPLLLIANTAFGETDLTGPWCVSMSEAYSASGLGTQPHIPAHPGYYDDFEYQIVIDNQDEASPYGYGILFYGHVDIYDEDDLLTERTYFSGVLDGKEISMTHWDSVTRGELKKMGNNPMEIHFINNAFDADNRSAKTSIGVAVKGLCP